jgi:hypothetical protein
VPFKETRDGLMIGTLRKNFTNVESTSQT